MSKWSFGTWLLILASTVNVSRWIGVFTLIEGNGLQKVLGVISGAAMGITMAAGIAFIFHRVSGLKPIFARTVKGKTKYSPNMRFWLPTLVGTLILGLSIYLLPPYMESVMDADFKNTLENPRLWSQIAVLAADLLVVAIAAVDSKAAAFTRSSEPSEAGATASEPLATKSEPLATKSEPLATKSEPERAPCKYCKVIVISQTTNGYNAHRPYCETPELWPERKSRSLADSLFKNRD